MNLHILLLTVFALINAIVLYLFMLQLPFGQESFLLSLAYWGELSSSSMLALVVGAGTGVAGLVGALFMDEAWKHKLVYMRRHHAHPARNAFLVNRKQPFEQKALLDEYPHVRDSGFDPQVQIDTWQEAHKRFATKQVIVDTVKQWAMIRDLYLISLIFLLVFLVAWLLKAPVPFGVVASHIFVFGAQIMFLSLTSRRVGYRLVDNVLGVSLGIEDEQPSGGKKGRRNKNRTKM